MGTSIHFQPELSQCLPEVKGNADYRKFRMDLLRMDELISLGQLDKPFIEYGLNRAIDSAREDCLSKGKEFKGLSKKARVWVVKSHRQAFRYVLVLRFMEFSFRELATRLADSPLLQRFCLLSCIDCVKVPSKSALERYSKMFPESLILQVINRLNELGGSRPGKSEEQRLRLENPINFEAIYLDATCVEANIHFPVDWVLLRDATRTLMKSVTLIRQAGLKNRMDTPSNFICSMNQLSIAMTHAKNRKTQKKEKKRVYRLMKKLMRKVEQHARKHLALLEEGWRTAGLTFPQAKQIIKRIENILNQLPKAIQQAQERIIGERLVKNKDKILSLYEKELHVCVRGKAGIPAEFGNTLVLSEQENGVIVDWKLYEEQSPGDPAILKESLQRLSFFKNKDLETKTMTTDRGMFSKNNQDLLEKMKIKDFMCPRAPKELIRRLEEDDFRLHQKRRAQTEGRIGIIKRKFFGEPLRSKEFENRSLCVAWSILAHNLWAIARLAKAKKKKLKLAA